MPDQVLTPNKALKQCGGCGLVLSSKCFRSRTPWCYRCYNAKHKKTRRKHRLAADYGITLEQYDAMLAEQGGLCLICETVMDKPYVDHDHNTGLVRGLLCNQCNVGLGNFRDNTGYLIRALDYLNHHKGND